MARLLLICVLALSASVAMSDPLPGPANEMQGVSTNARMKLYGDGLTNGTQDELCQFIVDMSEPDMDVHIKMHGPGGPLITNITNIDDNKMVVTYMPTEPGMYGIAVWYNGQVQYFHPRIVAPRGSPGADEPAENATPTKPADKVEKDIADPEEKVEAPKAKLPTANETVDGSEKQVNVDQKKKVKEGDKAPLSTFKELSSHISDLEGKVGGFQKEFSNGLSKINKVMTALSENNKGKDETITSLSKELESARSVNADLNKSVKGLQDELSTANKKTEGVVKKLKETERKYRINNEELGSMKSVNAGLMNKVEWVDMALTSQQELNSRHIQKIRGQGDLINELTEEVRELEAALSTAN